jgi:hypothetical protein
METLGIIDDMAENHKSGDLYRLFADANPWTSNKNQQKVPRWPHLIRAIAYSILGACLIMTPAIVIFLIGHPYSLWTWSHAYSHVWIRLSVIPACGLICKCSYCTHFV